MRSSQQTPVHLNCQKKNCTSTAVSRFRINTVVRSVNSTTVPRSVSSRAREESVTGSVIITVCINFSFTKCMAVVGKSTYLNDMYICRLKKLLLVNNGFLRFLNCIFLIVNKDMCETAGNNSQSRFIHYLQFALTELELIDA